MAVFKRLSRAEIERDYTHVGWFCGLVPVYIGGLELEGPRVAARNGVPEWWFDLVGFLYGFTAASAEFAFGVDMPGWKLTLTGKIRRRADAA